MPTIQVPGALEDDALLVAGRDVDGLDLPATGLEKVEAGISARRRAPIQSHG
jgi:hypothetical protein